MTWVDLAVLGLLAISGLLAFARGLVRELLGIAAWGGAVTAAVVAMPKMRDMVRGHLPSPDWVDPVAFAVTFLGSLIVLMIVASIIGKLVRGSMLGGLDRTLGLVFGLARGAVVVVIAYILGQMVFPIERWPDPVLHAQTLCPSYEAAVWARDKLPEAYRPHEIEAPPTCREATSEALLRAIPKGTATGKPADR